MKMKFYKKLVQKTAIMLFVLLNINNTQAQTQGLYADTIKWPNSNAITVNFKSIGFSNVIAFQGSIKWDKNSLQFVSIAGGIPLGYVSASQPGNYSFGSATTAIAQGYIAYIYSDAVANHTLPDGIVVLSINFNVINNPLSTYNNNVVTFSNTPTSIGIDTAADVAGLSDLATLSSPNLERHTSGFVSFARPPVLSYAGGNITDSVTNRPAGCTYQWLESGSPVAGPNASNYPASPSGTYTLQVTYPNGTVVTSTNSVLPIKLSKFSGKYVDNTNQLSWSTSVETNTNNFEIERSENSKDFAIIAKQKAVGSSSSNQNYSFTDAAINNKNTLYYRLKINDNNSAYSYSNIIKINRDNKIAVVAYPNPAKDIVNITGEKIQQITVTDLTGKVVLTKSLDFVNNTIINVANFSKGVYSLVIKSLDGNKTLKLIVE